MRKKSLATVFVAGLVLSTALSACGKSDSAEPEVIVEEATVSSQVEDDEPRNAYKESLGLYGSEDKVVGDRVAIGDDAAAEEAITEVIEEVAVDEPASETSGKLISAEINGFSFTKNTSYIIPAYTYFSRKMEDGSYSDAKLDGLTIDGKINAALDIGDITFNKSDQEGYVEITIPVNYTSSATASIDLSKLGSDSSFLDSLCYGFNIEPVMLFDFYSGACFIPYDISEDDFNAIAAEYTTFIEYDGSYQQVFCSETMKNGFTSLNFTKTGKNKIQTPVNLLKEDTYVVTVPDDYDGLCLAIYTPGLSKLSREIKNYTEETILIEDVAKESGVSMNDFAIIRVSSIMDK